MIRNAFARVAIAVGLLAATSPSAAPRPKQLQTARVRLVKQAPGGSGAWVAASLAPVRRATISTRLSATVRSVHVEEGAKVVRGQTLVTLSDEDVRAQLGAAETALANAIAQERRIEDLSRQQAATSIELEAARAQRTQAAATLATARAGLAHSQIRAPFDGMVQARKVNAGDLVGPGQPLVELEGTELEVQASLSDDEAKGLRIGQKLRWQAGAVQGESEITALSPGGDLLSHRRALRARVIGRPAEARSGSFARLQLPNATARASGAWIPRSALVERGDLAGVFVAEEGRARLRWLSLGEASGDLISVRAGLTPGDKVIDHPGALRDEQPIEVIDGD